MSAECRSESSDCWVLLPPAGRTWSLLMSAECRSDCWVLPPSAERTWSLDVCGILIWLLHSIWSVLSSEHEVMHSPSCENSTPSCAPYVISFDGSAFSYFTWRLCNDTSYYRYFHCLPCRAFLASLNSPRYISILPVYYILSHTCQWFVKDLITCVYRTSDTMWNVKPRMPWYVHKRSDFDSEVSHLRKKFS